MSEYREAAVEGTSRVRARAMHFNNPLDGLPSVYVEEERVTLLNGHNIITDCAGVMGSGELPVISEPLTDMAATFALRDPVTGALDTSGATATYGQVYVLLYSLYWHLAEARDAALP